MVSEVIRLCLSRPLGVGAGYTPLWLMPGSQKIKRVGEESSDSATPNSPSVGFITMRGSRNLFRGSPGPKANNKQCGRFVFF